MHEPTCPDEWRACVAMAEAGLAFDAARVYGLIVGGPTINVERCIEMIARGKARGYVATEAEKTLAVQVLVNVYMSPAEPVK